jgi:3-dehydrosphinganine reductase
MRSYYEGRLAFITGGSEGIGLAIAEEMTRAGAAVVIFSRDSRKHSAALARLEPLRKNPEQRIGALICDVSDYASLEHQLSAAFTTYGIPDFLINNAGFARPDYLEDLPIEEIRRMMDVNYLGAVYAIKLTLSHLMKRRNGHIVNVSSMAGLLGLFGYTGYCASKYALVGFSESLRRELQPFGIRVSVLCPPNTRTPGFRLENRTKPAEVLKVEEKVQTVTPEAVARALIKVLPRNPSIFLPTQDGRWAWRAARWMPWLADLLLKRPA